MLFDEYQEPMQLWRLTTPASGFADPVWNYVQEITGRVEPINPSDQFIHQQNHPNIMEVLLSPVEFRTVVQPGDGIVDLDGVQRKVVGYPEVWKWEMPHIACRLERSQFTVIS